LEQKLLEPGEFHVVPAVIQFRRKVFRGAEGDRTPLCHPPVNPERNDAIM